MFLPDQSDSVIIDSFTTENEARLVAVHYVFVEVWDTEKTRLLKS